MQQSDGRREPRPSSVDYCAAMSTVLRDLHAGEASEERVSPQEQLAQRPGTARMQFCHGSTGTTLGSAYATSPLRLLTPRNHGVAAWVYLSSFGGGLVDGDHFDVQVDVDPGAFALLGTQASTKVYRSPERRAGDALASGGPTAPDGTDGTAATAASAGAAGTGGGCSQRLSARVGEGAALALLPDPVVCFADARYDQTLDIALAPTASLVAIDGYTCGRSARGERWAFSRYASRTVVTRGVTRGVTRAPSGGPGVAGGQRSLVDATRLERRRGHRAIADRMGRFDVVLSLIAFGPRFISVREAMLAAIPHEAPNGNGPSGDPAPVILAVSPVGDDGCIVRVAAERFETASLALRSSFLALAHVLGDDPFARKW